MRSEAGSRVLERDRDRCGNGSPAELRHACESELAVHGDEIAAVERMLVLHRDVRQTMLGKQLRCAVCRGPMIGAKHTSRLYCSTACRQRAYRQRLKASPE
jgi:hypothetical protein